MLNKFLKKIQAAKDCLERPVVENKGFETGAQFWCYFCCEELTKHLELDVCVLKFGALLEHIACLDHRKKMYTFFHENKVDEGQQHPDQFFLLKDSLNKYKEIAEIHIRKFESLQTKQVDACKKKLYMKDRNQQIALQMDDRKSELMQSYSTHNAPNTQVSAAAFVEKKATFMAKGEGLTFIGSHNYRHGEGNVHTGAPPPWLQTEDHSTYGGEIGPTAEAFQKHLSQEKKRKLLPSTRVGAHYDRTTETSHAWLPSFGRVWNKGRRLQSKQYFEKQINHTPRPQDFTGTTSEPTSKTKINFNSTNSNQYAQGRLAPPPAFSQPSAEEVYPSHQYAPPPPPAFSQPSAEEVYPSSSRQYPINGQWLASTQDLSVQPVLSTPRNVKPYVKKMKVTADHVHGLSYKDASQSSLQLLSTPVLKKAPSSTVTSDRVNVQNV